MPGDRKRYRTWKRKAVGRCRNCGTFFAPVRDMASMNGEGDVEELEACERCAYQCPNCGEWLFSIDAKANGRYEYNLIPNDSTGKFELDEDERWEYELEKIWCPRCGTDLDSDLFQL